MPERLPSKVVDSLEEITQGRLLTAEDFEGLSEASIRDAKPIKYNLEIPKLVHWGILNNLSDPVSYVEYSLTNADKVWVPRIKGATTEALVKKWYAAEICITQADSYHFNIFKSPYQYQRMLVLHTRAAEIYKNLIDELLPLFEPTARNTVQLRLYRATFCMVILNVMRDFYEGFSSVVEAKKKTPDQTPQELIDSWYELVNLAAAFAAEAEFYIKASDIYYYEKYHKDLKTGKIKDTSEAPLHPDSAAYKKKFRRRWNKIRDAKLTLEEFLELRKKALYPLAPTEETIDVQVPQSVKWLSKKCNKSQILFSNALDKIAKSTDETTALLNILAGYKPIYTPPRSSANNPIDKDIILRECELITAVTNIADYDVQQLLNLANDGVKLISFAHMRYRTSLNSNGTSLLGLFDYATANKKQYFKILEDYLGGIQKFLSSTIAIVKTNYMPTEQNSFARQVRIILDTLNDYIHANSYDTSLTIKCINIIGSLSKSIKDMQTTNAIIFDTNTTGLKNRRTLKNFC